MAFNAGAPIESPKIFTGLVDFTPVMLNPTKEELASVGINFEKEPVYLDKSSDGNSRIRLDIWGRVKINDVESLKKITFFIEDVEKASQAGNFQFINVYGDSAYGETPEKIVEAYSWFKANGVRKAKSGEPDFVTFIKRWLSIGRGQEASLDGLHKLFVGNVDDLRSLLKTNKDRKLQVLLTVTGKDDKYYQNIYNRYFGIAGSTNLTYWKKHFEGSTSTVNYQNSFALKEFIAGAEEETPKESSDTATGGFWG